MSQLNPEPLLSELAELIHASVAATEPVSPDVADDLLALLGEPGADRAGIVASLTGSTETPVRHALARLLREDQDVDVRRACVLAARVDAGFDAAALDAACDDEDEHVRRAAREVHLLRQPLPSAEPTRRVAPRALLAHLREAGVKLAHDLGLSELRAFVGEVRELRERVAGYFAWLDAQPVGVARLGSPSWVSVQAELSGEGRKFRKLPANGHPRVALKELRVVDGQFTGKLRIPHEDVKAALASGFALLEFRYSEVRGAPAVGVDEELRSRSIDVIQLLPDRIADDGVVELSAPIVAEEDARKPSFEVQEESVAVRLFLPEWMARA